MHDSIEVTHKKLLSEWGNSSKNMASVGQLLDQLQNLLSKSGSDVSQAALFTISKDYYEIRALLFALANDMNGFEQAISDVHQFYEYSGVTGTSAFKSQQQYLMYGLHLMYLLATNKLSAFHMLIEQIDRNVRLNDPFLDVPVKLERYLTEGSYNKMTLAEKNLPSPFYKPFINILKQGIQNEIAIGLEKAYRSIPVKEAMKQLFITSDAEAAAFGAKRGWLVKGDSFLIGTGESKDRAPTTLMASGVERVLEPLDSERIIRQCLHYANQLERII